MNLRKKLKKLFKITRRDGGFTLVELIVVIAILGVLAGVAVPAYSGYVKKANMAADEALLSSINTAFASACIENGVNVYDVSAANAQITISEGAWEATKLEHNGEDLKDDFETYMGDTSGIFKVITGLSYDTAKGMFEVGTQLMFGGVAITVPQYVIDSLQGSTYGTIGGAVLGARVDSVSELVNALIFDAFDSWDGDSDNMPNTPFFNMAMDPEYLAFIGKSEADIYEMLGNGKSAEAADLLANGLVLYAAKDSATLNTGDIISNMTANPVGYVDQLKGQLSAGNSAALSEAALVYGVYTSYVYSTMEDDEAAEALTAVNGSAGLIYALETMKSDTSFTTYMETQGQNDVEAFLNAMGVIYNAASNEQTSDKIMNEGFASDELTTLLKEVLGK